MSETVSLDLLQFSTVSPHAWFLHGCEITTNKRLCGRSSTESPQRKTIAVGSATV